MTSNIKDFHVLDTCIECLHVIILHCSMWVASSYTSESLVGVVLKLKPSENRLCIDLHRYEEICVWMQNQTNAAFSIFLVFLHVCFHIYLLYSSSVSGCGLLQYKEDDFI